MKWIRKSGSEIETNDDAETIAYCESRGWKKAKRAYNKKEKPEEVAAEQAGQVEPVEAVA